MARGKVGGSTGKGRGMRRIMMSSRSSDRLGSKRRRGRGGRRDGIVIKFVRRIMDLFFESRSSGDCLSPPIRHDWNWNCVCVVVIVEAVFVFFLLVVVSNCDRRRSCRTITKRLSKPPRKSPLPLPLPIPPPPPPPEGPPGNARNSATKKNGIN